MKTKLIALMLLVVLTLSLASCNFFGKLFGDDTPAETTTAATTTDPGLTDPLRTEPAKVTTTAPTPVETPVWGPETPIK